MAATDSRMDEGLEVDGPAVTCHFTIHRSK
jgi:hypothetical protein